MGKSSAVSCQEIDTSYNGVLSTPQWHHSPPFCNETCVCWKFWSSTWQYSVNVGNFWLYDMESMPESFYSTLIYIFIRFWGVC